MPLLTANGYIIGQRERALVLDLYATPEPRPSHEAYHLERAEFNAALASLIADGLVERHWSSPSYPRITEAGLAAHAEAMRVRADLTAAVDRIPPELPSLVGALAMRAATCGPHAG